jgi:hypothetical protein
MEEYICRLQLLPIDASFEKYRCLRAKLPWICNARPDVCAFVSIVGSITERTFSGRFDIKAINDKVTHLQRTNELRLRFPHLDLSSLHLLVYTDAAFQNREDGGSQCGYIVLLSDARKCQCIIAYHSEKTKRVARSTMAAETLAFADGFDQRLL